MFIKDYETKNSAKPLISSNRNGGSSKTSARSCQWSYNPDVSVWTKAQDVELFGKKAWWHKIGKANSNKAVPYTSAIVFWCVKTTKTNQRLVWFGKPGANRTRQPKPRVMDAMPS